MEIENVRAMVIEFVATTTLIHVLSGAQLQTVKLEKFVLQDSVFLLALANALSELDNAQVTDIRHAEITTLTYAMNGAQQLLVQQVKHAKAVIAYSLAQMNVFLETENVISMVTELVVISTLIPVLIGVALQIVALDKLVNQDIV